MLLISLLLNGQGRDRTVLFLPATIVFGVVTSTIVVLRTLRDRQPDALLFQHASPKLPTLVGGFSCYTPLRSV
jgi:hypothetical protein